MTNDRRIRGAEQPTDARPRRAAASGGYWIACDRSRLVQQPIAAALGERRAEDVVDAGVVAEVERTGQARHPERRPRSLRRARRGVAAGGRMRIRDMSDAVADTGTSLSVVVPAYNEENAIDAIIARLLAQRDALAAAGIAHVRDPRRRRRLARSHRRARRGAPRRAPRSPRAEPGLRRGAQDRLRRGAPASGSRFSTPTAPIRPSTSPTSTGRRARAAPTSWSARA